MKKRIFSKFNVFTLIQVIIILNSKIFFLKTMSFLIMHVLLVYFVSSIDTYMNFTSGVRFDTGIKKALVK